MEHLFLVICLLLTSMTAAANTTYGRDSNGNTWSESTYGNTTYGRDSNGNTWSGSRY